ncbi:hypothetical protein [Tenacibaculum sp. SG-28]|uniref:hypothetical protein n=1 Tax=Tenacibaculum sp. SG-28 TaxID=754426 RepID=UPI000CF53530|nr:hypothetical protein [Tenacibaculum sp. SG-28]PQJ23514.1 hypothetical protein BSU00_04910 [Tenacibaculum sp. SG-28]
MVNQPLPYKELPTPPKQYFPGAIVARMLDGLGFRYYWATEGLREEDLLYRPTAAAWSTHNLLGHILALTKITLGTLEDNFDAKKYIRVELLPFEQLRFNTLHSIEKTSKLLLKTNDLDQFKTVFSGKGGQEITYPFWNQLNGPIADALWHVGQLVSYRRTSGNPIPGGINFFSGTVKKY